MLIFGSGKVTHVNFPKVKMRKLVYWKCVFFLKLTTQLLKPLKTEWLEW